MDPVTAGLGAAAGLGGGLLSYFGQQDTNATNAGNVMNTNVANAEMAKRQMDFQERMSNTAHQREVADLEKAGLNPILSSTHGGASSPGGATAQMATAQYESPMKAASGAPGQAAQLAMDFANKMEQNRLLSVQTDSTAKDVAKKGIENVYLADALGSNIKKTKADIDATSASTKNTNIRNTVDSQTATAIVRKAVGDALNTEKTGRKIDTDIKTSGLDQQQRKYNMVTDEMMEKSGLHSTSAKPGDSWATQLFNAAHDTIGLGLRRVMGK